MPSSFVSGMVHSSGILLPPIRQLLRHKYAAHQNDAHNVCDRSGDNQGEAACDGQQAHGPGHGAAAVMPAVYSTKPFWQN